MKTNELYKIFRQCGRVTTDSRTIQGGELFFALKGENFDGNAYALKALESGAAYAVVSADSEAGKASGNNDRLIPVEDPLRSLQELARWHRSMTFVNGKPLPVIGLTGTNGKTTTKELIRAVLSSRYKVTATEGNLNNSIGVPLSLLKVDKETQIAIIEMGASHPGDIKELVSVCLPDFGLITNVGKAHLLGFGSFEGVKKTKGELYDYIQRTADKVFINVDNPHLCSMAEERPDLLKIPYGLGYQNAEILTASQEHPYLRIALKDEQLEIDTNLVGSYNADNVMAALAVGEYFGVSHQEAAAAIAAYIPKNNRSQMQKTGKNTLIIDAYNANPTSMDASLSNFADIVAERKMALLGDMLELGEESVNEHEKVIIKAEGLPIASFCFVGEEFGKALERRYPGTAAEDALTAVCPAEGKELRWFRNADALLAFLEEKKTEGFTVLVKGSRGIRMEKVIPAL